MLRGVLLLLVVVGAFPGTIMSLEDSVVFGVVTMGASATSKDLFLFMAGLYLLARRALARPESRDVCLGGRRRRKGWRWAGTPEGEDAEMVGSPREDEAPRERFLGGRRRKE